MSDRFLRWLYNLLFPIAFLALLPSFLRRMVRRGSYQKQFGQRLGLYSVEAIQRLSQGPPRLWLQAVSVGEMLIALKLIAALRQRSPGLRMVLSTTTTTGFQLAESRAGEGVEVVYTPIDFLPAVRRAFKVLRPSQIIIVEGGLWPNMLWESYKRGISVALASARLSPRSERRFRRFLPFAAPVFRMLDLVCASEREDVQRWQSLGVPAERIVQTGNVKFDESTALSHARDESTASPREVLRGFGVESTTPVLLAGSTHPGEEKMIAQCYLTLRGTFPKLLLIVAPRHVERTVAVRSEMEALHLKVVRRTEVRLNAAPAPGNECPDVLLLDTTGELRDWYPLATVVFIGKSLFAPGGGQNPAEAVTAGKAVVFGPFMDNFCHLAEKLLANEAAIQVQNAEEIVKQIDRLLNDEPLRAGYAARGEQMLKSHEGAARRTVDLLLQEQTLSPCQQG